MDLRRTVLLLAALVPFPALGQEPAAPRRVDLSGTWRTSADPSASGEVTLTDRRTDGHADHYAMEVALPTLPPIRLLATFDGQRLAARLPGPATGPIGLGDRLEGRESTGEAVTLEWTLGAVPSQQGVIPPFLLFRATGEPHEPVGFARTAFQLVIRGEGRGLAVGTHAAFSLAALPLVSDPVKAIDGEPTWSAEPADAVELRPVGQQQLLVVGRKAGEVVLTCSFLSQPLGDRLVATRRLVVLQAREPLPDPSRAAGPGQRLAIEGLRAMRRKTDAHLEAIARTGVGVYFGSDSEYAELTPEERREWAAAAAIPGTTPAPPRRTSCIDWALECVVAAYERVGRGAKGEQIRAAVVAGKGRGTVLARELIADGWTGIYWNPDTRVPADGDTEHTFTAAQARKRPGSYYGLPVGGLVIDYRPTPGSPTAKNGSGLERLAKVPFWFGIARGGKHTFVGSGTVVNEQHYEAMPNEPLALEETPLERFAWLSGLVVVPPGTWQ